MSEPFPPFDGEPITRATGLAYVVFARPSIDKATAFLQDFGLTVLASDDSSAELGSADGQKLYVVRKEPRPRFVGLAMYVDQERDLEHLVAEGLAEGIENEAGVRGRRCVRMVDPNGNDVIGVLRDANASKSGDNPAATGSPNGPTTSNGSPNGAPSSVANTPTQATRVNQPFVPPQGVPRVKRIGHAVMESVVFTEMLTWYQRTLGMRVSDYQTLPDGTPVVAFCRFDRGDTPTDHHSLALGSTFRAGLDHVAFEVDDIEAVTRGQQALQKAGWKHVWGVGRHIMGSQVFDYWYDPCGTKHEHYADGDQVTVSYPMGKSPFGPEHLAQWGPRMPPTFIGGPPTPKVVWDALRSVATGKMSASRLVAMVKAARS